MNKWLENLSSEESFTVFQYLKSGWKEDGGSLFTISHTEKTTDNGYSFHWERFDMNIKNKFFILSTVICWNNISSDVVGSPSLKVSKTLPDRVLDNLL